MPVFSLTRTVHKDGVAQNVTVHVHADSLEEAHRLAGIIPPSPTSESTVAAVSAWLMRRIAEALCGVSFWACAGLTLWWNDSRLAQIETKYQSAVASQQRAAQIMSRIPAGSTVCSDGWVSGSQGRGTCSHHGGASLEMLLVQMVALTDPWGVAKRSRSITDRVTWAMLVLALLVSPALDARLFRGSRKGKQ